MKRTAVRDLEEKIIRLVIAEMLKIENARVSVHNGDEVVLQDGRDTDAIVHEMFTTDQDTLCLWIDGEEKPVRRWVMFVYGNSGYDVIHDHTMNVDEMLGPVYMFLEEYA